MTEKAVSSRSKQFYQTTFSFNGLSFAARDEKSEQGMRMLYAVFYYVHHEMFIEDINRELRKNGLRPITKAELQYFYNLHKLSIASLDCPNLIATAPEDIRPRGEGSNDMSVIPGIWRDQDDQVVIGNVSVTKLAGKEIISDHQWFVVAIDETKHM